MDIRTKYLVNGLIAIVVYIVLIFGAMTALDPNISGYIVILPVLIISGLVGWAIGTAGKKNELTLAKGLGCMG